MRNAHNQSTAGKGSKAPASKGSTSGRASAANGRTASKTPASSPRKAVANTATTKNVGGSQAKSSSSNRNTTGNRNTPGNTMPKKAADTKKASNSQDDLRKVFKDALKDIYYAEKQMHKALGKMAKAAANQDLKQAFEQHKEQTQQQIEQLNKAFELLDMRASGKKCPAMDGLVEEGSETMEEFDKGPARDAAMIMSAQKAEHYEISSYGTLRSFANALGEDKCAQIFSEILHQESETDDRLTQIAINVNEEAMASSDTKEPEMAY